MEREGFDCDTEFFSGVEMGVLEIVARVAEVGGSCRAVVFTGGEPALQLDDVLVKEFKARGYYLAIETNGTLPIPSGLDWVCVSPKSPGFNLRLCRADEIKIIRSLGQRIPDIKFCAAHKWISPAFTSTGLDRKTLLYVIEMIKENPEWKLSMQQHRLWGIR